MTGAEFATFLRRVEKRLAVASADAGAAAGAYIVDPHDPVQAAAEVIAALLDARKAYDTRRHTKDIGRSYLDDEFWDELRDIASDSYQLREALRAVVDRDRAARDAEEDAEHARLLARQARHGLTQLAFQRNQR